MASLMKTALGDRFAALHPRLQEYFGLEPGGGKYLVGHGVFSVAGPPARWLRPVFAATTHDDAFFGEYGTEVPFTVEGHAHLDPFARPSLTMVRYLGFPGVNRTVRDTTSWGESGLVDYLGRSQRIAAGTRAMVGPEGSFRSVSEQTRLFVNGSRLRVPPGLDARTYTWQRFEESSSTFHIQVSVQNRMFGTLFHYAGRFTAQLADYPSHEAASHGVPNVLPEPVTPKRWEAHA